MSPLCARTKMPVRAGCLGDLMLSSSSPREYPTQLRATVCVVPDPAPPYDDVGTADDGGSGRSGRPALSGGPPPGSGPALSGGPPLGGGSSRGGGSDATRSRGVRTPPGGGRGSDHAPADGREPGLGGVAWPSQFAQILAETLAGSRPSRQLSRWTTERARTHIRRLGPLLAGRTGPQAGRPGPQIRRIVASAPSSGVVEMAVVVRFGPRVRALAVRLERDPAIAEGTAWRCTAIEAA